MLTTEQRWTVFTYVRATVEVTELRECFLGFHRAVVRYRRHRVDEPAVVEALTTWAAKEQRSRVTRLKNKMRRLGFRVNWKGIARLCRDGRLLLKRRRRRKRVAVVRAPHLVPTGPNQRWSMDFVHDRLADGRAISMLTMLNEGTQESPALVPRRGPTARHVIAKLERLAVTRSLPITIAVDNGADFTIHARETWAEQRGVHLSFNRPGESDDNAFMEIFNSRPRDKCPNEQYFTSLVDSWVKFDAFRVECHTVHIHSSLGNLTPAVYAARFTPSAPAEVTRLSVSKRT